MNPLDGIISAEIPPPNDPLHALVEKLMIHGPCGPQTCKINYPRSLPLDSTTRIDDGCFGVYRRRHSRTEGGSTCKKCVLRLHNGWVLPYSPYLLKMFGCHINMEYCATVLPVKYLQKGYFQPTSHG